MNLEIEGLSKADITEVIHKVASNHKNKDFDIHTPEDIEQEVWCIVLSTLSSFNITRSTTTNPKEALERWLNTVVSRRLANFYRDRSIVPHKVIQTDNNETSKQKRINLMHPIDIDALMDEDMVVYIENILDNECWRFVIDRLDNELMDILDSILSGEKIVCYYKNKLLHKIQNILETEWHAEKI